MITLMLFLLTKDRFLRLAVYVLGRLSAWLNARIKRPQCKRAWYYEYPRALESVRDTPPGRARLLQLSRVTGQSEDAILRGLQAIDRASVYRAPLVLDCDFAALEARVAASHMRPASTVAPAFAYAPTGREPSRPEIQHTPARWISPPRRDK